MADRPPSYLIQPAWPGRETPLVFASPHSGDVYPADMAASASRAAVRSAEDVRVDQLIASGPEAGAAMIVGRIGRAYVDLNRAPDEFDPALSEDEGGEAREAAWGLRPSAKALAGYGVVPRRAGDGTPLYDRRLTQAEVEARVAWVHAPYHAALAGLMQAAQARFGRAILIDWHSMPSRATARGVDVVLGDRHGDSCDRRLTRRARALFEAQGLVVTLNQPYAGGYATQAWGRPGDRVEALQIELSRRLYWDEAACAPSDGWGRCQSVVRQVIAGLAAEFSG